MPEFASHANKAHILLLSALHLHHSVLTAELGTGPPLRPLTHPIPVFLALLDDILLKPGLIISVFANHASKVIILLLLPLHHPVSVLSALLEPIRLLWPLTLLIPVSAAQLAHIQPKRPLLILALVSLVNKERFRLLSVPQILIPAKLVLPVKHLAQVLPNVTNLEFREIN